MDGPAKPVIIVVGQQRKTYLFQKRQLGVIPEGENMRVEKTKIYKNKEFKLGQLASAIRATLAALEIPESSANISGTFDHGDGGTVSKDLYLADIEPVCTFDGHPSSVSVSYANPGENPHNRSNLFTLSSFQGGILLILSSSITGYIKTMLDTIQSELSLEEMPPAQSRDDVTRSLESRVETLESKLLELGRKPSCFLSYRFNPRSKAFALELSRFLQLLGVDVLTGLGYEPRKVSEKVLERLKGSHEFFVYLITKEGESTWTRDELAVAYGSGVPVVLLIEKGVELGKGLLGDWEYIAFDADHIGDTFIPILEALKFISERRGNETK